MQARGSTAAAKEARSAAAARRPRVQCAAAPHQQRGPAIERPHHHQQPSWSAVTRLAAGAAAAAAVVASGTWGTSAAWAAAPEAFATKCAGCHLNGGNVLQPGATLFTEDLQVCLGAGLRTLRGPIGPHI
jgi:hypothetical protein